MSPATQKIISAAGALAESADNYLAWTRISEGVRELRLEESAADAALLAGGPAPAAEAGASMWTDVDVSLPDEETDVIICTEDGHVEAGFLDQGQWRWLNAESVKIGVTHWMEFPLPPNGEGAK
jgi:hypothetical protein